MRDYDIQREIDHMTEHRMTRIEFLAHKATQAVENRPGSGICVASEFNKEFARLIIQDCVAQIALVGISNTSYEDDGVGEHISWACSKSIECIKEHFNDQHL
jgi:hypothetical protein